MNARVVYLLTVAHEVAQRGRGGAKARGGARAAHGREARRATHYARVARTATPPHYARRAQRALPLLNRPLCVYTCCELLM